MTIENFDAFKASLPDWSILDGCFGGRIRPCDIDGAVERKGHVLFLEHKSTPTAKLKDAQRILFEALSATGHAAIIFWSEDGERNVRRLRIYSHGQARDQDPADLDDLRAAVAGWYRWANGWFPRAA
jgi:hypothetical protein